MSRVSGGQTFVINGLSNTDTSVMELLTVFQKKIREELNNIQHVEKMRLILTRIDQVNPDMGPFGAMERDSKLIDYGIGGVEDDESEIAATFIVGPRIPRTGART